MTRDLVGFSKKRYDLLVIGGGINGAAITNLAAAAGARVALVDKGDWGSGTSSKSTKLLHGGIRYLENLEFDLVAESLKERFIQWKSAPHLVKPLRFIIPVYRRDGRPLWMMRLGVWLYDVLSGKYSLGGHQSLSKEQIIQLAPGIKEEGLRGGVSYFDAQMDDARLCLENVLMARKRGADVLNYVEAFEFIKEDGHAIGARLRDMNGGESIDVMAEQIIVCAGPWTDSVRHKDTVKAPPRLRPTKGVHVLCLGDMGENAFLLQNKEDKRVFFAIPFRGNTLIGTTDTDYKSTPDQVRVEDQDIDYLLAQAAEIFPHLNLSRAGIITTFVGLRPLVYDRGSPSKISRKHTMERQLSGVYYVMGGKYTTYRVIALECLNQALPKFAPRLPQGEHYTLFGSGLDHRDTKALAAKFNVDVEVVGHLMSVYGSRFEDVLSLCHENAAWRGRICSCGSTIGAQVAYAVRTEMATNLDDIYERRLGLVYDDCPTKACRQAIARILQGL